MAAKAGQAPRVAAYSAAIAELASLRSELGRCAPRGIVADDATSELAKVRKRIEVVRDRIRKKLDTLLGKYAEVLQERIVYDRGGRHVLAVKKTHKRQVPGLTLDESASGQTVFVEPAELASLQQELAELRVTEDVEVTKVLAYLTGLVEQEAAPIRANLEWIGFYDALFARAKYAAELGANRVTVRPTRDIHLVQARHPLLLHSAVPLDFTIGRDYRALIITGPNTGGKTVALKTIGLLTTMVQSGLLVPTASSSQFGIFADILVDIGDGQSLEQSLSTFSAHVKNVIDILRLAGPRSLVLLDELASGTDPGEGVGLAIAVLEALSRAGVTLVATTHYNEIKRFAGRTDGFENARMEFDVQSLQPLYRLVIGEAGMSYGFQIALKLGMDTAIIDRAQTFVRPEATDDSLPVTSTRPSNRSSQTQPQEPATLEAEPSTRAAGPAAFAVGDRVWIHPLKKSGIVAELPDDRGNLVVVVKKRRQTFNVKRVAPYLTREALYPDDYDLDIVLVDKGVRKARKVMRKRHVPGLSIEIPEE